MKLELDCIRETSFGRRRYSKWVKVFSLIPRKIEGKWIWFRYIESRWIMNDVPGCGFGEGFSIGERENRLL